MKRLFITCILLIAFFKISSAQYDKFYAAYMYQFTKFIEWCPDYKTGDFVIAIVGNSSVETELQALAQTKKVVNQPITIKRVNSAAEIGDAQMVFITSEKNAQLSAVLAKIINKCTVVITEKTGGAKAGAAINFVDNGGKITFEINKSFFSNHNLIINSQLTNLAKAVY